MRSRFKIGALAFLLFLIFWGGIGGLYGLIQSICNGSLLLFGVMLYVLLAVALGLREFNYIKIDKWLNTVTWYSVYSPFGRRIAIGDCKGIIVSEEYSASGVTIVVHLVDRNMYTCGKISSFYYSNFDELISSIDLPEIKNYEFGVWKYLKLLATGRIKVKIKEKKKRMRKRRAKPIGRIRT